MIEGAHELHVEAGHPCFAGHFPGQPIVPGALLLQRLQRLIQDQSAGWLVSQVNSAKFLAPVRPGDTLTITCYSELQPGQDRCKVRVSATLGEKTACQAIFTLDWILENA